ncbi:hypothetical protein KEM52_005824 [Ascosphaera acerosa]|nr:hypothetical protein KEM52_005824 [Ascosphaera acerosa]
MSHDGVRPDGRTLATAYHSILPPREHGRQPRRDREARAMTSFMLSLNQAVCLMGGDVSTTYWAEPLRRLGMVGPWDEFRAMLHWLARFYVPARRRITPLHVALDPLTGQPQDPPLTTTRKTYAQPIYPAVRDPARTIWMNDTLPGDHPASKYRQIFSPNMQRAIVAWGFRQRLSLRQARARPFPLPLHFNPRAADPAQLAAPPHEGTGRERERERERQTPEQEHVALWCRGIILLRELKHMGVVVQTSTVQRAVRSRLAILYGDADDGDFELREPLNRLLREENRLSLQELLADINKCWPGLMRGVDVQGGRLLSNRRRRAVLGQRGVLIESGRGSG